jgi:hypothetical protein
MVFPMAFSNGFCSLGPAFQKRGACEVH